MVVVVVVVVVVDGMVDRYGGVIACGG